MNQPVPIRTVARVALVLTVLLGGSAALAIFFLVRGAAAQHAADEIEKAADNAAAALQLKIDAHVGKIRAAAGLMASMGEVSREQFRAFVRPRLSETHAIRAVEWAPVIRQAERAELERAVRAEGFPEFRLTERNTAGEVVTARVSDTYVPVLYVEPLQGNESALGYADLGSSRSEVIARSRDGGVAATSDPLWLVQAERESVGILVIVPVYHDELQRVPTSVEERRARIRGFVEGVFLLHDLVGADLSALLHVELALHERESGQLLFDSSRRATDDPRPGAAGPGDEAEVVARREVRLGDRQLVLTVTPGPGFPAGTPPWAPVALLLGGLALTGLLFAFVWQLTTQERRVAALVQTRTHELALSQQELFESRQLESVGRMAGGIAHDFNNLLTAIIGFIDFAADDAQGNEAALQNLDEARMAALKAGEMTKQLLAFSRRQVLRASTIDLNEGLRGMRSMLRPLVGDRIHVELDLTPEPAWVLVDQAQLTQVVTNLAANARDAIDGAGTFALTTRLVTDEHGQQRVQLVATDTGGGMDEDTLGRVFEPFFTTKQPGQGTGLGLATVFGIVNQSGGSIVVTSEPDRGSQFTLTLPSVPPPAAGRASTAAAAAPVVAHAASPPSRRRTVLLLEDLPEVRRVVTTTLEQGGYEVHVAQDAASATALMQAHRERIDVVLLDVVMPSRNGVEVARDLLALAPSVPILFMSGNHDACTESERAFVGQHTLLGKPFTATELLAALEGRLQQRSTDGESPASTKRPAPPQSNV